MREAWSITSTYFRTHGVRARLSTIQAGLLDLHGRLAGPSPLSLPFRLAWADMNHVCFRFGASQPGGKLSHAQQAGCRRKTPRPQPRLLVVDDPAVGARVADEALVGARTVSPRALQESQARFD